MSLFGLCLSGLRHYKRIRTNDHSENQNGKDTKEALERAKDVIMVEKIRLWEDLRIATMEKKRLSDSERILLNTFDTLKKYYDTKDNQTENADKNEGDDDCENLNCNQCIFK